MIRRHFLLALLLVLPLQGELIDRLARDTPNVQRISAHSFSAATFLWATGVITRQNVIDGLVLLTEDEAQLDEIAAFYVTLSAAEKREFHGRVESATILLQNQIITRAQYKTILGMT